MSGGRFEYLDQRLKDEIFGWSGTWNNVFAEFKKKWFSNRGVRVRRIVDETLDQAKRELYNTFGLEDIPHDD